MMIKDAHDVHWVFDGKIDLSTFERQMKINGYESFYGHCRNYIIKNLSNGTNYIARVSSKILTKFSMKKIKLFYKEISLLLKLNHPAILKCYGYSLINFKNKLKPVMVMEYTIARPLYYKCNMIDFNYTKMLINMFGIASAMSYLHSHDIIHRNIYSGTIFLDRLYYPKITGFEYSSEVFSSLFESDDREYLAPEVLSKSEFSKASDVYAYGILIYKILLKKRVHRWDFIDDSYTKLIKKCLSKNPKLRPTFDQIIIELKTNPNFITKNVDKQKYLNYIKFIETSNISFDEKKVKVNFEEISKFRSHVFDKLIINIENRGPNYDGKELNLANYELKWSLENKKAYELFEIKYIDKEKKKELLNKGLEIAFKEQHKFVHIYHAQVYYKEINFFTQQEIINFYRKMNIISQINHPAILNFIGYSPTDFNGKPKPTIVTEYSKKNLQEVYDKIFIDKDNNKWNSTRRLIFIYGIASAMAYLHSHNIIHRDLKLENIYLDEYKLPKLTGFDISKILKNKNGEKSDMIKGTPAYLAPEIYSNKEYSKSSDVYSFSLIVYQILTGDRPFEHLRNPNQIKDELLNKSSRPKFDDNIEDVYRDLMERCWSEDPKKRPSFDEIVNELKTNPLFITEEIDKEDYFNYINFIDEFPITFDPTKRIKQFDFIIDKINTFEKNKSTFYLYNIFETELNGLLFENDLLFENEIDINHFSYPKSLVEGSFYNVKLMHKIRSKEKFVIKELNYSFENLSKSEVKNFSREIDIIQKLNHPSILEFVGFNSDLNNFGIPKIILKYEEITNIYEILNDLDFTKKLKIIYGIASAMAYLHSHNIIHRDLKLENIYLDEYKLPKLTGFNISKILKNENGEKSDMIKGTPAYLAPEIYSNKEYSKSSDVYSFSFVIYEILTGKIPYDNTTSPKQVINELLINKMRPKFEKPIKESFIKLVERCWHQDPRMRPTFDEIIKELRTNPEYIIDSVNKEEYEEYIKYINESPITFGSSKHFQNLEYLIQSYNLKFKEEESNMNIKSIYKTEYNNILTNNEFVNIKNYEKKKLIDKSNYKLYKFLDINNNKICFAKKSFFNYRSDINRIDLKINHPSILRFIGFSPIDLKNKPKPIILFECGSKGTLSSIFDIIKKSSELYLDKTKQLIIAYGIASAMSYLHSHKIDLLSLNPSNIYLDEFLYPKIFYLDSYKMKGDDQIPNISQLDFKSSLFKNSIYCPPEQQLCYSNNAAGNVYAYSMIVYELITNEVPFSKVNFETIKQICFHKLRPKIKENIQECFKNLLEKCWAEDPKERPTFDEIVYHLKTNKEFITDQIDKEEYYAYINFIEESQKVQNLAQFDDFIKTKNKAFRKVQIDFNHIKKSSMNFMVNFGSLNLQKYEKQNKIGYGGFGVVYKIIEKETLNVYAAKISIYEIDQCHDDMIINLSREINIISRLNHECILKFIGFSPINFKNKSKPVIITEFASNSSLDKILEMERNGFNHPEWNDTKKLINIYGIASGMAYLHKKDILHRDLKPGNILLDDYLYPKIADFGLSKVLYEKDKIEIQNKNPITSGFKGTYAYCAPEIIDKCLYTKAGDVYAFGMIVYEIITGQTLYKDYNIFKLINEVLHDFRPKFKYNIPYSYRKLIRSCWKPKRVCRPGFAQIIKELENDRGFITNNVDEEEYLNYISLVKDQEKTLNKQVPLVEHNEIPKKVSFGQKIVEKVETEIIDEKNNFLDLIKYKKQEIISKFDTSKIYKFEEIETGEFYLGQMLMHKIKKFTKEEIEHLSKELQIIKDLKHPILLKFIGLSLFDFKKELKPVIVTELAPNGTLDDVLQMSRNNKDIKGWDDTKKLINIFGIASGMSYLHSQDIIHCSLKPSAIYLDEILTPKISDFGLSTHFISSDSITHQTISGIIATPIYSAPEVLHSNKYTKSSDVYSFASIVFEIITNEKPFNEIGCQSQIFNKVVELKNSPEIPRNVSESYRCLIEKCWSQDLNERPTFDEIVFQLKNDSGFITQNVNIKDYEKYIKFIEEQLNI